MSSTKAFLWDSLVVWLAWRVHIELSMMSNFMGIIANVVEGIMGIRVLSMIVVSVCLVFLVEIWFFYFKL